MNNMENRIEENNRLRPLPHLSDFVCEQLPILLEGDSCVLAEKIDSILRMVGFYGYDESSDRFYYPYAYPADHDDLAQTRNGVKFRYLVANGNIDAKLVSEDMNVMARERSAYLDLAMLAVALRAKGQEVPDRLKYFLREFAKVQDRLCPWHDL